MLLLGYVGYVCRVGNDTSYANARQRFGSLYPILTKNVDKNVSDVDVLTPL